MQFRGDLNHQVANFDELHSQIQDLEGQLKYVPQITLEEKDAQEKTLAQEKTDKEAAIWEKEIAIIEKAKAI